MNELQAPEPTGANSLDRRSGKNCRIAAYHIVDVKPRLSQNRNPERNQSGCREA
jgi:hypothetical protein